MKQFFIKRTTLFVVMLCTTISMVKAQSIPTLELEAAAYSAGQGPSTTALTIPFSLDLLNNNLFIPPPVNPISLRVSLVNQAFTGLTYPNVNSGVVFGASPTLASEGLIQQATPFNNYDIIGSYGGAGGPRNNMFTSNPKAVGAQLGTGIDVDGETTFNPNGAVELLTVAQALYNSPNGIGSRVYFGDLVLRFSQPVTNPVIHLAGLGGSYRYQRLGTTNPNDPTNYNSTFFSTELELVNSGLTSVLMSGNQFIELQGNNVLNNNNANPNGGSIFNPLETPFSNVGAATGSIKIIGTVQELVYKIYLQSGTSSQFAWSAPASVIQGATHDPFTGDVWFVSASLDNPTLQVISGNVFNDADGLADGNISETFTSVGAVTNPKTNAGGVYAHLLNNATSQVVASVPIGATGVYVFESVPVGTYRVQLTTVASAGTYASPAAIPVTSLPAGWVNTGEFNGTGVGNDGSVNGQTAPIVVLPGDVKINNNFGIERLPDSKNFTTVITTPPLNAVITLNTPGVAPYGNLPILTGSDPEDQAAEGVLTGKTVRITTLATVGTNNAPAVLKYNGATIVLGINNTITNFNPALLTVTLSTPWTGTGLKFNYAYVDAAGLPDPTPALYRLLWSGGGPLVINLSEFNAVKNNCTANLNWKTSTEVNGDRFEVQISTNTNPVYTTVGSVLATGNSSTPKSYQYSFNMQSGVIYYFKLKMIDKDGSFTYSDTRSLTCSNGKTGVVIAPNPVYDIFKVWGMENGKNIVSVYAANGQLVNTQVIAQNQGEVNVSYLAPGMYTVKVTSEKGNTVISKLIKY